MRYTSLTTTISHDNNNHCTSKHASKSWRSDVPIILPGWEHHTGGSRSKPTVHPCPLRWRGCGLLISTPTHNNEPKKTQHDNNITVFFGLFLAFFFFLVFFFCPSFGGLFCFFGLFFRCSVRGTMKLTVVLSAHGVESQLGRSIENQKVPRSRQQCYHGRYCETIWWEMHTEVVHVDFGGQSATTHTQKERN